MESAIRESLDQVPGVGRWDRPAHRPTVHRPRVDDVERSLLLVADADLRLHTESVADVQPRSRSELLCRALNLTVAAVALVLLSPVMLLVAVAIKLTSRGTVFYKQDRVGLDRRWNAVSAYDRRGRDLGGKPFTMYKFRTMRQDAEQDGIEVWAQKGDSRVTRVGRLLRMTRLDEVPQLYNVIRGDMNIVGPRPERPGIFAQLRDDIPHYPLRQRVKPGITGWAQVNQSYDSCIDDVRRKVAFDLEYVRRQSFAEDIRIMSMTVPVMLFAKGGW